MYPMGPVGGRWQRDPCRSGCAVNGTAGATAACTLGRRACERQQALQVHGLGLIVVHDHRAARHWVAVVSRAGRAGPASCSWRDLLRAVRRWRERLARVAQTPQGLVRFPGTWRLIERGLVSGRSWSTLLGYGSTGSLFADRSKSCTLHESIYDWLLDGGTRRMTFG